MRVSVGWEGESFCLMFSGVCLVFFPFSSFVQIALKTSVLYFVICLLYFLFIKESLCFKTAP